jgi:molybdopterin-guanine dinucleotide biosynthesis protein A
MDEIVQGLILAGGLSSRMGSDKALLPIDGKPLIRRLAEELAPRVPSLAIAIGPPERAAAYRAALGSWGGQARLIPDAYPGCGPLAGLHAALAEAPPGYVFVIACDMPSLSPPLYKRLAAQAGSGADIIHCAGQPFHALYHSRIAPAVEQALQTRRLRVMGLLGELNTLAVATDEDELSAAFINLNTPEDFGRYVKGE